jgi:flagellar biosynthesis/type III secretory pathway M-ring protein FliF/YscJ
MPSRPAYQQTQDDQSAKIEEILADCYPVIQQRADELTRTFFENAQKKQQERGQDRGFLVTMTSARAVVLAMILATDGRILE